MPVPRRKLTRARRDSRRAHIRLSPPASQKCPRCGELKLPHRVCLFCGFYKETEVIRQQAPKPAR